MAGGRWGRLVSALRRRWDRGAPPRALVAYLPRVRPGTTAVFGALVLLSGALPVAFAIASGHLVGAVPAAVRGGTGSDAADRLQWLVLVTGALFAGRQIIAPLRFRVGSELGFAVEGALRARVMAATMRPPGIGHLEDTSVLDRIALARGIEHGWLSPMAAIDSLGNLATRYITSFGSFVVVCTWRWPVAVLVVVAYSIFLARCRDHFRALVQIMVGETETFRRADYIRDIALTPLAAKEVRVFGLGDWLAERYRADLRAALVPVWKMRSGFGRPFFTGLLLASSSRGVALALVAYAGANGDLSLTAAVALLQSLSTINQFTSMGDDDLKITQGSAPVPAVLSLEDEVRHAVGITATGTLPATGLPATEITFDRVSFAYPGRPPVFDGLDLTIEAGRSLAVVGVNGAGKTTLVKLLARLYDPTAGRILVDGVDLRDLDAAAWQRRVAAIFQDFVRYELSAAENIGFGAPERLADRDAIRRAATGAGALEVIENLPSGFDTILSRQYEGGADISGGEWQRIALARALLAVDGGAGVLVLDEPTANLDVRSEARLYDRFLDITAGLTSIVISHRFSTVRRADRIVVLDGGRVIEDGSHDELVDQGGRYARMYRLQSARFADEPATIGDDA